MTPDDFTKWFRTHMRAYPSVISWLEKYPQTLPPNVDGVTREGIRDGWYHALEGIQLEDALQATRLMQAGQEQPPRILEDTPAAICRIARELARQRPTQSAWSRNISGEQTVACRECQDRGTVVVYNPRSVQEIRKGTLVLMDGPHGQHPNKSLYTQVVRCRCAAGDKHWLAEDKARQGYPTYDPQRFCPVSEISVVKQFAEVLAWIEDKSTAWRPEATPRETPEETREETRRCLADALASLVGAQAGRAPIADRSLFPPPHGERKPRELSPEERRERDRAEAFHPEQHTYPGAVVEPAMPPRDEPF